MLSIDEISERQEENGVLPLILDALSPQSWADVQWDVISTVLETTLQSDSLSRCQDVATLRDYFDVVL